EEGIKLECNAGTVPDPLDRLQTTCSTRPREVEVFMGSQMIIVTGPHAGQPILLAGEPLEQARAALVLVHGRGATADDILSVAGEWAVPHVALLAPQAEGNSWYPQRFTAPLAENEPWLSSALSAVRMALTQAMRAGIPQERLLLLGFSQGACLALEYAARNAQRYGGLAGLSGGLIGPEGTPRDYAGSLSATPTFLGCSDVDPPIPAEPVRASAQIFGQLGAEVELRLYPNMGHTINDDEVAYVRALVERMVASG